MREEIINDCRLILGDCRDVLPTLGKFDLLLTDPPYGINADKKASNSGGNAEKQKLLGSAGNKSGKGWKDYGASGWDSERPNESIFVEMLTKAKVKIIWGGNYFTDILPPTMQWLVWDKGQRNFTLADCEFAWTSQNNAARVFDYPRALALQDGKEHPTQKPIALMEWCVQQAKNKPKTVFDPFMGSGTTGIACVNLGKAFTGIEREPKYFDIACRRIEDAYRQQRLFV